MTEALTHPLSPVYNDSSRVLILGTFPSPKSREAGFYYSHPQNRFWRVLCALFDEPFPSSATEKKRLVLSRGIALWDVLQSCEIDGADDASIRRPVPNDIAALLQKAPIQVVFTTGTKAAALYKVHCLPLTGIPAEPLPSTSPANCRKTLEELTEAYRAILPFLAR